MVYETIDNSGLNKPDDGKAVVFRDTLTKELMDYKLAGSFLFIAAIRLIGGVTGRWIIRN
jgi:hypothetical protein